MDKVRYTSLKFKIWEDKQYKIEKQRQHTHLDEIKIEIMKKKTMMIEEGSELMESIQEARSKNPPLR